MSKKGSFNYVNRHSLSAYPTAAHDLWPALAFFTAASKSTGRILMTRFWVGLRRNAAHCHLGVFFWGRNKKTNKFRRSTFFVARTLHSFEMWGRWNYVTWNSIPRLHALHPRRLPLEPWIFIQSHWGDTHPEAEAPPHSPSVLVFVGGWCVKCLARWGVCFLECGFLFVCVCLIYEVQTLHWHL